MLLLGRKVDEDVVLTLGDAEIVVKVVEIRATGRVRLGFEAPDSVKIMRRELIGKGSERAGADCELWA